MADKISVEPVKAYFDQPEKYLHKRFGVKLRSKLLRDLLPAERFESILDIGCGDGSLSLGFAEHAKKIVLLDISGEMLRLASERFTSSNITSVDKVSFRQGDFLSMSFNEKFDLILLIGVIAHVPDVVETMNKLQEILSPDGYLAIQFSDSNSFRSRSNRLFRRKNDYQLNRTSLNEMVNLFDASGFKVLARRKYMLTFPGMKLLPDNWLYRLQLLTLRSGLFSVFTSDYFFILQQRKST